MRGKAEPMSWVGANMAAVAGARGELHAVLERWGVSDDVWSCSLRGGMWSSFSLQ